MYVSKTGIASAWYQETGLRFKGRIRNKKVYTPYGIFSFRTRQTPQGVRVYFPYLYLESASCPLIPEVLDDLWENQEGELEYVGAVLPHTLPLGYKSLEWVQGVAVATRRNGAQVVMNNQ